ncbi:biotin--[acetyl-CoA-carboxylase] ligase [Aestuariimicrobium sp. p3-SID1156]|uniref:biotin--[acetyl-CoA-carboxylase] ligase n=1 Tax=Aestuariimicrobium sp. p3-SID1156 TaxID=2916038 RepID=UPI00223BCADA|nr:biotin--[acetyl-CoA-carboxylase] ligase [Aestuariimicrobium sp. p3-SID1156]MCT1460012.1 biotin--[acetyl-CoA-carboxylase] ligase [Aestuariimicrobium sp. p3-SID1156]
MTTAPLPADAGRIRAALALPSFWTLVHTVAETGSTNRDVAQAAQEGMPEGYALISEHQTAGRGRFERRWQAPPGASVGLSVLLRPTRPFTDWSWLALLAGLAVQRAVRVTSPQASGRVVLKWPNDVLIQGEPGPGKLCGILCERVETPTGPAAVLGVGINIALAPEELPVPTATSLAGAGLNADKDAVLSGVLDNLAELYQVWAQRGHLREAYGRECATIGQDVRVQLDEKTNVLGRAVGVDESGALQVRTHEGVRTFVAGDVFHLRPTGAAQ